ncbi:MAG: hypothetical protein HRT66_10185 [Flavobacteriaceae bacterium]|nr:hypothetical protein [Flavobacteriaceae bacterium]
MNKGYLLPVGSDYSGWYDERSGKYSVDIYDRGGVRETVSGKWDYVKINGDHNHTFSGSTTAKQTHFSTTTQTGKTPIEGGDEETRPKNRVMYWIMRIP